MNETTAHGHTQAQAQSGQHHPIRLYLVVWGLLFVLSAFSYMVDYLGIQGYLRWSLILLFMMLKAGLIVAVFMHMAWGTAGTRICHPAATAARADFRRADGIGIALYHLHAPRLLRPRILGAIVWRRQATGLTSMIMP